MQANEVQIWDVVARSQMAVLGGISGGAMHVAFSPDGRTLAACGTRVRLWNIPTMQEVASFPTPSAFIESLGFAPDGDRLFLAGPTDKGLCTYHTLGLQPWP